ncbi:MAG: DNA mismatch repair protein MutS [Prevotella sp.]|nr:DNA mismatch repair protein MutS [Prevotella sp.]
MTRSKESIRDFYRLKIDSLTESIISKKKKSKIFVTGELTSFSLMIACVCAYIGWGQHVWALLLAAAFLIAYLIIRRIDTNNSNHVEKLENLKSVYRKEAKYLEGDYSLFAAGDFYIDPHHPFTFDMDIFGADSLFHRINRTITTGGSNWLARELANDKVRTIEHIKARNEAISELSEREQLRTSFLMHGQQGEIDTADIIKVMTSIKEVKVPQFALKKRSLVMAICVISGFAVNVIAAIMGKVNCTFPVVWGIVQFFLVFSVCARPLHVIHKIVSKIHRQLKAYIHLIGVVADSGLKSSENVSIIRSFVNEEGNAMQSFKELKNILDGIDRRGNVLGLIIFNVAGLSDFFLVRRFLKWQSKYMLSIEEWIEAISHFDALVSMATFHYNEPLATNALLVRSNEIIYKVQGLYHPFLGSKAVKNDFEVKDSNYYIITGANMAGKSTFLRAVGINYILAMNGMPVFADNLQISVFSLFSSMRTTDDLTHGISYFNAELLRLKQLMEVCGRYGKENMETNKRTLIILDEILKGTNSLDKLNGSRLFLQEISRLPVTGIIATHDLELSKMDQNESGRFHNYCFEIELAAQITYTYKITKGVARNQNATFLLNNMIKGIS